MCDPVSIGVAGLAGGVMQGIGGYMQDKQSAASDRLNAAGIERDIGAEREATAYSIARTREGIARTQGSARAGYASNGLALSGSAADVLTDTAIEGDLDVAAIQWNSDEKVKSMKFQAQGYRYNAAQSDAAAPISFLSGALSGASKFGNAFG